MLVILIILVVALLVALILLLSRFGVKQSRETGESSSVYAYLQAFDVQDIDLRRAPTGGWHGTYRNDLAAGVNRHPPTRSGTLGDENNHVDDDNTTNTSGGVDDAWAKTRLAQLGSSPKVLASLFADAGTGSNYHGISIEDHDSNHGPSLSENTTSFGEKAVIHLV